MASPETSVHTIVRKKSYEDLGASHIGDVFRGLIILLCQDTPSNIKDKLLHLEPPTMKKRDMNFSTISSF